MPGDHHIFGILATHWHEFTKKHKHVETSEPDGPIRPANKHDGEGCDLFLWTKCFEVCKKHHSESLPCFTMADFNVFLTSHTQNFITTGCGALKLYNEIFGKQNLKDLLAKGEQELKENEGKETTLMLERLTVASSDVGNFLDDIFILRAVHSVALFLQTDFENPLIPMLCVSHRKREAHNSINYYLKDVDHSCLLIPTFLKKLKRTMVRVEELKVQIYTEGSTLIMQDLKDEIGVMVKSSYQVSRKVARIIAVIDSGSELLTTLSTWAGYESTLADVHLILKKRHEQLMRTSPFDRIHKLKSLCDYLIFSSQAIAGTVEELEEILSESQSLVLTTGPSVDELCMSSSREGPTVVELSRHAYPLDRLQLQGTGDSK